MSLRFFFCSSVGVSSTRLGDHNDPRAGVSISIEVYSSYSRRFIGVVFARRYDADPDEGEVVTLRENARNNRIFPFDELLLVLLLLMMMLLISGEYIVSSFSSACSDDSFPSVSYPDDIVCLFIFFVCAMICC